MLTEPLTDYDAADPLPSDGRSSIGPLGPAGSAGFDRRGEGCAASGTRPGRRLDATLAVDCTRCCGTRLPPSRGGTLCARPGHRVARGPTAPPYAAVRER